MFIWGFFLIKKVTIKGKKKTKALESIEKWYK